jgi:hypothetical protein
VKKSEQMMRDGKRKEGNRRAGQGNVAECLEEVSGKDKRATRKVKKRKEE